MKRFVGSQLVLQCASILALTVAMLGAAVVASAQDQQPAPLKIALESLPDAIIGEYYGVTSYSTGGKRPYGYSAEGLPEGLYISRNSDRIMGIPKMPGTYNLTITVKDFTRPTPVTASAMFQLKVVEAKK